MLSLLLLVLVDCTQGCISTEWTWSKVSKSPGQGQRNLEHFKSNSERQTIFSDFPKLLVYYPCRAWQHQMFRTRCVGLTGLHWSLARLSGWCSALLWSALVCSGLCLLLHRLIQHRKLQISLLYHGPWLVATNFINNQKHFRHSKINLFLSSSFSVLFKFLGCSLGSSRVNHWNE